MEEKEEMQTVPDLFVEDYEEFLEEEERWQPSASEHFCRRKKTTFLIQRSNDGKNR